MKSNPWPMRAGHARKLDRVAACVLVLAVFAVLPAHAQWIYYPNPSLPRTADGKLDVNAPPPKVPSGEPDFSGLWEPDNALKYLSNLAADLPDGAPLQPWARELLQQRMARLGADNPNNYCLPSGIVMKHAVPAPFKIVQLPDLLVFLYESRMIFRQVFLDGRPFPEDPQPAWHGYSVGHWEGDALVVESMGFNDKFWLDTQGRPSTEQLRVTERFTRPTFGRLEVEITIDDPGAYKVPWTVKETMHYLPDTDIIEHICEENNKFDEQIGASGQ